MTIIKKIKTLQFSRREQQAFLEDVSALIEDGVPASQAIQTIEQIATGPTKWVSQNILQKIAEGKYIADGMYGWFPHSVVEIIRAGEEGGTLAQNMIAASRAVSRRSKGFGSLLNSMIYPAVVLITGLIVAIFIKNSVLTNFAEIKPISQWPSNGQLLYTIATWMEHWWWCLILILIALVLIISRLLIELTGDLRKNLDTLPFFSLYRSVAAAQFTETLGLLLSNGIILKRALNILRVRANNYIAWHILMMEIRLSGGRENIAEVLDTGLLSKADVLRLRVIAKGKGFEHALVRLGQLSAERTQSKINLTGKILGFAMLGLGAMWAAFMIFTIYSVGSTIAT